MTLAQLKQTLYEIVRKGLPADCKIRWANTKITKSIPPFVLLNLRQTGRSTHPIRYVADGATVKAHPAEATFEMDLYTPGREENGVVVNSAADEIAEFLEYLEYPDTENDIFVANIAIHTEGATLDVTAILDGVEPEFRARQTFTVYYTAGQTEDGTADPYARENPDSADGSYQNAAGQNIQATGYFTEVENPAQKREE